jgi:hypothetical protein
VGDRGDKKAGTVEIRRPGLDTTLSVYRTTAGARSTATQPGTPASVGNIAYVAWTGDPIDAIAACERTAFSAMPNRAAVATRDG